MLTGHQWKWRVSCYYGPEARWPKAPGALAIQTVHADDWSKDLEVKVAKERPDIGEVLVEPLGLTSTS